MKQTRRMIILIITSLLLASCSMPAKPKSPEEIKLSYTGTAYDLPLLAAYQNGYFEEAGLNVILLPVKQEDFSDSLQKGLVDGGTGTPSILIDIYQGLPVKIGGGVRGACVEILSPTNLGITKIEELEQKRIGIVTGEEGIAAGAAALKILRQKDIDYHSIEWIQLEETDLTKALTSFSIDALVQWQGEDFNDLEDATILYQNSSVKNDDSSGHHHGSGSHFYKSFAVISENLAANYPESASMLLSAWMKGVNAVTGGLDYQLNLAEKAGYITDTSHNAKLTKYMFDPGIKSLPESLYALVDFQKEIGLLPEKVKTYELVQKSFVKLLPDWD